MDRRVIGVLLGVAVLGRGDVRAETRPGPAKSANAAASADAACPDPATTVTKLQQRYDATHAFRAEFKQEMRVASLGVSDQSDGTVAFKKPGKMRWDFQTPHAQQIISDGNLLWIYQPEDRQVLKVPFKGAFVSTTPVSFLLGVGRITDEFRPGPDPRGCSATRLYVGLIAKNAAEDLGALAFGVDRATFDIVEAAVTDPMGNVTTLTFSNIARNVDIPDDSFKFEPPAGVDVITPPGAALPPS
jgi:outer membrane lipoprotein carrier protein